VTRLRPPVPAVWMLEEWGLAYELQESCRSRRGGLRKNNLALIRSAPFLPESTGKPDDVSPPGIRGHLSSAPNYGPDSHLDRRSRRTAYAPFFELDVFLAMPRFDFSANAGCCATASSSRKNGRNPQWFANRLANGFSAGLRAVEGINRPSPRRCCAGRLHLRPYSRHRLCLPARHNMGSPRTLGPEVSWPFWRD